MIPDIQDSVVLITSRDGENGRFGTGFVIRQVRGVTYLLTCAHVIRDVGGAEKVKADGVDVSIVASGEERGLDLAVLKVDGLSQRSVLDLREGGERGNTFRTIGFQSFGKDLSGKELLSRVQELRGTLGELVGLQSRQWDDRIKAWELRVADDSSLQPGYSGSPVIDAATGKVFAVVSHRQGDKVGLAISIEELTKIWNFPDSDQLYQTLLDLGYRDQVQLFRKLASLPKSSGAFAIHGEEFYGQSWLLNRLVFKYIPERTTAKVVRIKLGIKVRHNDIQALWRELGEWFGMEERHPTPSQIADKVYNSWQTQHVLLVLHEVERMPQAVLNQLIQQFWVPLMLKVGESAVQKRKFKLLMFLVDYKGIVGSWQMPFAEQVDKTWNPEVPVRSPKLAEFSYDDLSNWLEDHRDKLPFELTEDIDSTIATILEETDGVPEATFDELCLRCVSEWEEESKKVVEALGTKKLLRYIGNVQPKIGEVDQTGQSLHPYLPYADLVEAVNLAIQLERPLLLKGEPGCGKTQLAKAVAYELGLPFKAWYIKSTSRARDGLYTYDSVARLRDAQLAASNRSFLKDEDIDRASDAHKYRKFGPLGSAFLSEQRIVVLIDEIDKADIDFPNDLLLELDEQRFIVDETGEDIRAKVPSIVFITSNDEKDLPDAFLRRCLFHYVEFPSERRLKEIINATFPASSPELIDKAVDRFLELREIIRKGKGDAGKNVSTSELIDWFKVLRSYRQDEVLAKLDGKLPFLGVLLKSWADHQRYLARLGAKATS